MIATASSRHHRRPRTAAVVRLAALTALALLPGAREAGGAGRSYRNDALRILAFEIPRGWTPAPHLSWPGILLLATGGPGTEGARLVLAAQRMPPGQDALGLAAEARTALIAQRFGDPKVSDRSPGTGGESRSQIDATYQARDGRGALVMRQLYVVSTDVAVVITLTVPQRAASAALIAFDRAVESLVITPAPLAPAAPAASEAPRPDEPPPPKSSGG